MKGERKRQRSGGGGGGIIVTNCTVLYFDLFNEPLPITPITDNKAPSIFLGPYKRN